MVSSPVDCQPRSFTLTLPLAEIEAVYSWATRFAPVPMAPFSLVVQCIAGLRRWWVREANVLAWCEFPVADGEAAPSVPVPYHFLRDLDSLAMYEDSADVVVSLDDVTLSAASGGGTLVSGFTGLRDDWAAPDFDETESFTIEADDVARAGLMLTTTVTESSEHFPWFPFTTLMVRDGSATFTRDWSDHGLHPVRFSVPATGDLSRSVSFYNEAVCRELAEQDVTAGPVRFSLSDSVPHQLRIACGNQGMLVDLGSQVVLRHRVDIEAALRAAGMEPESDDRPGWNPLINVRSGEHRAVIALTLGTSHFSSFGRVSITVAEDLPWTHELGSEINAWNDKWTSVRIVHIDNALVIVHDVPAAAFERFGPVIADMVEKTITLAGVTDVFR